MRILRRLAAVAAVAVGLVGWVETAGAATSTVTTSSGYSVSIEGPASATVGVPATYTAVCGSGRAVSACQYGEFRAFGGPINRLGEGFGRGATGTYAFRAPGFYSIRYRVGASCPGSPRLACPIDVWLYTTVA